MHTKTVENKVLCLSDIETAAMATLLAKYNMTLKITETEQPIPGSFWGDEEAGLIGDTLFARADTPIHSILHEAGHYICMSADRRDALDTNAGGDYDEENGVCYLQILLADHLPGLNQNRMLSDMDSWGYSFRLGSARSWFEQDAVDARNWLIENGIIDPNGDVSWQLRKD